MRHFYFGIYHLSLLLFPCVRSAPYCMTSVTATVGPMARDVDTIVMAMRALCCDKMFELDPHVIPVKFRDEVI